jgi:very-short-patch-repair endonuclease
VRLYKKPKKPVYMTGLARGLRRTSTETERLLWEELRNRKLDGLKFKRQAPLGRYVLDFNCAEAKLAVELDGEVHDGSVAYDAYRDECLKACGIHTLRLSNESVQMNLEQTLQTIRKTALSRMCAAAPNARTEQE